MLEPVFDRNNYFFNPHAVPIFLAGGLIFAIGVFILTQTKKTVANVAFFLFCMSLALWLLPMGMVYMSNNPDTALWWYRHFVFLGVVNIMPNFYLFSVATIGFLRRQRAAIIAGYVFSNIFYLLAVTTDQVITTPHQYFWGYYPHYEPLTSVFFVGYALLFTASEVNLWVAYRREQVSVKKAHILIIFVGLLVGFLASFDFVAKLWPVALYPFGFIPSFILSSLVAFSVIKYKAFDIETVIHKTILWVLSFSVISVPILFLYRWAFPYMISSGTAQAAFGLGSFIIFTFYLRVVQPKIDHVFQRRKADLEAITSRFTGDLVHLKGLNNLVKYIEDTVSDVLYPQWIDIFIFNEGKKQYLLANRSQEETWALGSGRQDEFLTWLKDYNRIVYSDFVEIDPVFNDVKEAARDYFKNTKTMLAVPLVLNEQLLGVINLGKKANLSRYNALDLHFLDVLRNQSAIAISNSLIYQNIEEQVAQRTEELVAVQRQLIQAEKLATVGTLSGGVAHEINNPLTAILTNVQMLLAFADNDGAKMDKEALELIEEATQRCRTIVQKLMAYAKKPIESGEVSRINLEEVLEKVIAFLGYQLEQDNVSILSFVETGEYPVLGNHNELEQMLTNVLLNARDAIVQTPQRKGQIRIELRRIRKHYRLEIRDDGHGIPQDILPKIFDPFFTTKDVGKGLGLGLSICHSIIDKHKGHIKVASQPGHGAVFTIELPIFSEVKEFCGIG